ncbi:heptaprenyl diphosphate synthase component I [Lachnospiraceae bacterium KM106-2]|nr:heptaprenyl diphosphate synthase component I [Lachnospiraceae bacterium KM106-2]
MSTKKVATFGVLVALAFIFSYIESLIPFYFGVPGMKLGLANIVVLTALYKLGVKEAYSLCIVRIILVGFTFGNLYSLLYSIAGGLLSCTAMVLLKMTKKFSQIGVSAVGGIMHNVGQITVAMIVLETSALIYYLPALLISGVLTGALIGVAGGEIIKRLR